jgi:hypothetical protein
MLLKCIGVTSPSRAVGSPLSICILSFFPLDKTYPPPDLLEVVSARSLIELPSSIEDFLVFSNEFLFSSSTEDLIVIDSSCKPTSFDDK